MYSWIRLYALIALAYCSSLGSSDLLGQNTPTSPDTARARRIVDSLIQTGAWKMPATSGAGIARDTARQPKEARSAARNLFLLTLRTVAFLASIVVLTGLGWVTIKFAQQALVVLQNGLPVGVRNHWGDFGGGNAGWEASPALSLIAVTVVLAILTAIVTTSLLTTAMAPRDNVESGGAGSPGAISDSTASRP